MSAFVCTCSHLCVCVCVLLLLAAAAAVNLTRAQTEIVHGADSDRRYGQNGLHAHAGGGRRRQGGQVPGACVSTDRGVTVSVDDFG